jgi:Zn-dependent peptidase ImmA (M78 family)
VTLRRGFKTVANNLALEVRAELGLRAHSRLCPFALAENLYIPVFSLSALLAVDSALSEHVEALVGRHRSAFSAITVFNGRQRCIIHNHRHAPVRQRSNVAHELAHALLLHPPHPASCSSGSRIYDRELEEEASWLGPVLLVANEGARWAVTGRMSLTEAADYFEVSEELMEFRFRMSGARQISRRVSRKTA